jgi:hypothetical protein
MRLCVAKGTLVPAMALRQSQASTASSSAWGQSLMNAELKPLEETTVEVTHAESASELTTHAIGGQIAFPNLLTQENGFEGYGVQEQDLQDYNRKLKEFEAQQQTLQNLQAQLQKVQAQIQVGQAQPGGIQGEPQCNVASEQRPAPHFDLSTSVAIGEADIEAELQRALFGEAAGLPSAEPVVFGSSLSPIAEGADLPIAESTLLEPAPADLASMVEVWTAYQASSGVADESLDVSRDSTVCMGLQELGLDSEHRTSANPKRRNSQVELRNSQGDSPAPAMRGLTN